MPWRANLRADEARAKFLEIVLEAQTETFEKDIVPEAQDRSPVRTGYNVAHIESETAVGEKGVTSTFYSDDKYGGYQEVGTKKMKAHPYALPAFLHGILNFPQRIYRRLHG